MPKEQRIILQVCPRPADPGVADRFAEWEDQSPRRKEASVAGLSKALASLIQAFKDVFRVGKRPAW